MTAEIETTQILNNIWELLAKGKIRAAVGALIIATGKIEPESFDILERAIDELMPCLDNNRLESFPARSRNSGKHMSLGN